MRKTARQHEVALITVMHIAQCDIVVVNFIQLCMFNFEYMCN